MSMVKEMWMERIQSVGDEYAADLITREEAESAMRRLGFDPAEIKEMLDEVLT